MVIKAIKKALENMDKRYCTLSQIDYSRIKMSESNKKCLRKEKYLERPFAYEFYHQLRTLIDNGSVNFGGHIIQAEVDKRYQHIFEIGKIPDFIIHVPNNKKNLVVIEVKLANNLDNLEDDFKKLVEFKMHKHLKYIYSVEIIIGDESSLERAKERIKQMKEHMDEKIIIIEFNTELWKANDWKASRT